VVRRLAQVHPCPRGDQPGAGAGPQRCDVKLHTTSARCKPERFFPSEHGAAAAAARRPLRLIARVVGGERRQHRQQVHVGLAKVQHARAQPGAGGAFSALALGDSGRSAAASSPASRVASPRRAAPNAAPSAAPFARAGAAPPPCSSTIE